VKPDELEKLIGQPEDNELEFRASQRSALLSRLGNATGLLKSILA